MDYVKTPDARRTAEKAVASMLSGDHAAIQDATQDALLSIWTGRYSTTDFDTPAGLVWRVARLWGLQFIRTSKPLGYRQPKEKAAHENVDPRRRKRVVTFGRMDENLGRGTSPSPEDVLASSAFMLRLEAGIAHLSVNQRAAVEAWIRCGTEAGAAQDLGITEQAVKNRIGEAKKKMRVLVAAGAI